MARLGTPNARPQCPRCGHEFEPSETREGSRVCLACGKPYEIFFFAPVDRAAAAQAAPLGVAEAGPGGATPCARHPGNAATASCDRCGVFVCALCRVDLSGKTLCPSCFDRLEGQGELVEVKNRFFDYRGLGLAIGVLGWMLCYFSALAGPFAIYCGIRSLKQLREWNEVGGRLVPVLAILLGLGQLLSGLAMILLVAFGIANAEGS